MRFAAHRCDNEALEQCPSDKPSATFIGLDPHPRRARATTSFRGGPRCSAWSTTYRNRVSQVRRLQLAWCLQASPLTTLAANMHRRGAASSGPGRYLISASVHHLTRPDSAAAACSADPLLPSPGAAVRPRPRLLQRLVRRCYSSGIESRPPLISFDFLLT